MTNRDNEEGAILILALIIVSVLATATLAVAQLGFANPKAAHVYNDHQRLVNALDSGLQAAVENARLQPVVSRTCGLDELPMPDADGQSPPIKIIVDCIAPTSGHTAYTYNVSAFLTCADKPESQSLTARVSYVTAPAPIATVTSWKLTTLPIADACASS